MTTGNHVAVAAKDREAFYAAAVAGLRALDSRERSPRRFGPDADTRWASFKGALTESDRRDETRYRRLLEDLERAVSVSGSWRHTSPVACGVRPDGSGVTRSRGQEGTVLKDFREFAMRGNVMDMAVGIIIGGAFGKIVSSLVSDVIMPPIGMLLGKLDFSNLFYDLSGGGYASGEAGQGEGCSPCPPRRSAASGASGR